MKLIVTFSLINVLSFLNAQSQLKHNTVEASKILEIVLSRPVENQKKMRLKIDTIKTKQLEYAIDLLSGSYKDTFKNPKNLPEIRYKYLYRRAIRDSTIIQNFLHNIDRDSSPKELSSFIKENNYSNVKPRSKSYFYTTIPLFNRDGTIALVLSGQICPGLCGTSIYSLYILENGEWNRAINRSFIH